MVYIERGLGCKWLAVLFAVFCIFASFGMGNMTQANSMASGLKESLSIPPFITGAVVTLVVAAVILGGVKRIAAVTEKVVPFVALFLYGRRNARAHSFSCGSSGSSTHDFCGGFFA